MVILFSKIKFSSILALFMDIKKAPPIYSVVLSVLACH